MAQKACHACSPHYAARLNSGVRHVSLYGGVLMNRVVFILSFGIASSLLSSASCPASAQSSPRSAAVENTLRRGQPLRATLNGAQAVPAVLTPGSGEFKAFIENSQLIRYELRYSGLIGGSVGFISIHFGQPGVNGGFIAILCGVNEPPCPSSGNLQGSITASDIRGPVSQGVPTGDLAAAIRALQSKNSYVVIRTNRFAPPGGEIRGQIRAGRP